MSMRPIGRINTKKVLIDQIEILSLKLSGSSRGEVVEPRRIELLTS